MNGRIIGEKHAYDGFCDERDGLQFSIKYINKNINGEAEVEKDISFFKKSDYSFSAYVKSDYGNGRVDEKVKNVDFVIDKDNIFYEDFIKFIGKKEKITIEDDEPGYKKIEKGTVNRIEFSKNEDNNVLIRYTADNEFEVYELFNGIMVKNILPDGRSKIDQREERERMEGKEPDYLKVRLAELFKDMRGSFEKEYWLNNPEELEKKYTKMVEKEQRYKKQKQHVLPIKFSTKKSKVREDEER